MKNNKGITLVELLTVLIILIIIFLLAIIKVNDAMDDAEIKAVKASATSYVKAVNDTFILKNGLLLFPEYEGIYTYSELKDLGVTVSGTKPVDGYILNINNKTVAGCLRYKDRRAIIENDMVTSVDTKKCDLKKGYNSDVKTFIAEYTGGEQTFTIPVNGKYKLEVWGAQGGESYYNSFHDIGGYGGYSVGTVTLNADDVLYINVGGQGASVNYKQSAGSITYSKTRGYNGGGGATTWDGNSSHGGGGGATHIATKSGLLSTLSDSLEDVLIVAGGGGGASTHSAYPNYSGAGGSAGGFIGVDGIPSSIVCYNYGTGANLEGAGAFAACTGSSEGRLTRGDNCTSNPGFGSGSNSSTNNTRCTYGGGGAGLYGGGSGWHGPGAGGTGYIGNSLLTLKSMYCYNCTETESVDYKTISSTNTSEKPIAKYAKKGNGYARIILIEEYNSNNS